MTRRRADRRARRGDAALCAPPLRIDAPVERALDALVAAPATRGPDWPDVLTRAAGSRRPACIAADALGWGTRPL
jgi:hypothetical protein